MGYLFSEGADARRARLHGEGNWDAFRCAKDGFLGEGYSKKAADEMSHRLFPPGGTEFGPVVLDDVVSADSPACEPAVLDLTDPDIRRDAYWCYNAIGVKDVSRDQAPSQGAWNMFKYFGRNDATITDFLEKIAKPMLSAEPKGERYSDDGRELIALCERYRAEKVAELAEEAA